MRRGQWEELRESGVTYGTLSAISVNIAQLCRNGLSDDQVMKAVENLHPRVMSNLRFKEFSRGDFLLEVVDKNLVWIRRNGWIKRMDSESEDGEFIKRRKP